MSSSTSPFVIDVSFDSSVASAPAGFTAGVEAAVSEMESLFVNPVTITIDVGYGEAGGNSIPSYDLGGSQEDFVGTTYSALLGALTANAASAADRTALASLPLGSPVSGRFVVPAAEQFALGLLPANQPFTVGSIGFSTTMPFTYDDSGGVAAGTYDFTAAVESEISVVMGRVLLNGVQEVTSNYFDAYDLFHYAAPGVRDASGASPGYFSIDGGVTDVANFTGEPGFRPGDWAASTGNDAFDADPAPGVANPLSATDITALNVLGWNLSGTAATSGGFCMAAGTRVLTATGEVEVEKLRAGDRVVSAFGGTVPVVWLGHRHVDCRRHPRPFDVWPVRIKAGAFGGGRPSRDLLLSPDHAVYVGWDGNATGDGERAAPGVLVPVRHLVNGTSIVRQPVNTIEYWHVELPQHDVMLTEGLPTESYLDTGNRSAFEGGGPALQLHPEFARLAWEAQACAPQITHGPILLAIRRRLAIRAASAAESAAVA